MNANNGKVDDDDGDDDGGGGGDDDGGGGRANNDGVLKLLSVVVWLAYLLKQLSFRYSLHIITVITIINTNEIYE